MLFSKEQIKTLLLDMDGTLLDLHFDNFFWREHIPKIYAQFNQISLEKAHQIIKALYLEKQGTLDWYCLDYWTQKLDIDIASQKQMLSEHIEIRPSVREFLESVKRNPDLKVCLVTNAHQRTLSIKLEKTGIGPYFDVIVSSHDFGMPKEEQQFWGDVQNHIQFEKKNTLFIDDSLPVLRAAKRFGIGFIYGVRCPDSKGPPVDNDEFEVIDDFSLLQSVLQGGER